MRYFPQLLAIALMAVTRSVIAGPTTQPATRPAADADVDWLLQQSTPSGVRKPVDAPTSRPSPFAPRNDPDVRAGTIHLSNGEEIHGHLSHTREKPVRVWIESAGEYRDVPFRLIARFDARVTSEYDEKEWHFKASGSDIKEFTGKTYPVRETQFMLTLINGQTVTGGIVEPIYVERTEGAFTFSLLKRDKGLVGQTLKDLVYVKSITFDDSPKKEDRK